MRTFALTKQEIESQMVDKGQKRKAIRDKIRRLDTGLCTKSSSCCINCCIDC